MSAKHTPGPWYAEDRGERHVILAEGFDYEIAEVVCDQSGACSRDSEGDENAEADARLIAAAPDLLMALEAIDAACADALNALRQSTDRSPTMIRAQAAATLRDGLQSIARAAIAKARGGK